MNGQGKALHKMVNENDYPMKIKNIMDELRHQKEKCKELEQQLRQAERMQSQLLQHNQSLERRNALLVRQNKKYMEVLRLAPTPTGE